MIRRLIILLLIVGCEETLEPEDACGVAGGYGTTCADCAGVSNGDAVEDMCSICDSDATNDCIQDCAGVWDGNSYLDECDVCNGNGIANGACDCDGNIEDCNNVCGGGSANDDCGLCTGGSTGLEPNYTMGCDNVCFSGLILDECEVCGGGGIADGDCDCDENVIDECGVCGGSGSIYGDTGCCENLVDECGVCGGSGEIYECGCSDIPGGYCDCDQTVIPEYGYDCEGCLYDFDGNGICDVFEDTPNLADIDGNIYETVQIGDQLWMAENLKVTHYNNGDEISYPIDSFGGSYDEGQYSVYDNDPANADVYGNLYNWAVVGDDRGVCSEGFHVPSADEWTILTDYLGDDAGGKMKSTGTIEDGDGLWYSPNTGATNESGFTCLPAGFNIYTLSYYYSMGLSGYFWSSTAGSFPIAPYWKLSYNNSNVSRYVNYLFSDGYSIRCLKD